MLMSNIRLLFSKISKRRKWQMCLLSVMMIIGAIAEVAVVGAIIPFLAVLSSSTNSGCGIPYVPCHLSFFDASVLFVTIVFLATVLRVCLAYASNRFTYALGADIGNEIYSRVLFQPYKYHISRNTSEIISGINKVNILVQQVISPIIQGMVSVVMVLAIFIALLQIDAVAASAAMIVFGALYLGTSISTKSILRANSKTISERETLRIKAIQEGLGGIRDVIIDSAQMLYADRFGRLNSQQRRAQATNAYIRVMPRYIIEGLGMVLIIGLAWWVGLRASHEDIVPLLGAMALGAQRLLPQLQQIYAGWASVSGNQAIVHDVLNLLNLPMPDESLLEVSSKEGSFEISAPNEALISIKNLSFSYSIKENEVLKGVNLEIKSGENIGLVGSTGSGKSTLIDLIMGLLEPTSGLIRVQGVDLLSRNRKAWQKRIAHVPQSIYLADASLAENIAFGCDYSSIDMERVKESARKAQLTDFIKTLPSGYRTIVGERGVRLSGGQRQRIGLARAFYKQVDIMVLDEATSALDDTTEDSVMESVHRYGREMTVLMIAHRLSTLSRCDRIIHVDEGKIMKICSFEELMKGKES